MTLTLLEARDRLYGLSNWPFSNGHRYWTAARCLDVLAQVARERKGPLPVNSAAYNVLKTGRLWPPSHRLLEYWQTIPDAWVAAGVPLRRLPIKQRDWTRAEKRYLLDHAGETCLEDIARRLHRTVQAVRTLLGSKGFGIKARENQGFMSVNAVALEFGVPIRLLYRLVYAGVLPATYNAKGHRWQIEPRAAQAVIATLPKPAPFQWTNSRLRRLVDLREVDGLAWFAIADRLFFRGAGPSAEEAAANYRAHRAVHKARPRWGARDAIR